MSNNTKLLYLFLKAQTTAKSSEQGYSMAMVSIITIILFSLMVAATILSNMAKARTNAFVDSNSAFYVAEAGLNKRAAEINKILKSYAGVTTGATQTMDNCFATGIAAGGTGISARSGTNDLECVNYRFQSSDNIARSVSGENFVLDSGDRDRNTYVAYTLVTQVNNLDPVTNLPPYAPIPAGDPFAGLNATSYVYRVASVGKKPVALPNTSGTATATAARDSSNNVTLQMTFINRVVPLFQFGIFYNGDLELNSTSDMQINGWVHSNANMYLQPSGVNGNTPTTTFLSNVSAVGSIFNRVDAWTTSPDNTVNAGTRMGITRLLLLAGGGGCVPAANCRDIPAAATNPAPGTNPLDAAQLAPFNNRLLDGAAGATQLTVPSPGFGRKRNYLNSPNHKVGESFAKADIRIEMVPDRDVTTRNVGTPWTRDRAIIPFNFTSINTTGTGACTTAAPAANTDPAATYVDPERENASNLRCNIFTKGQLQSLRQPVMVLTNFNSTPARGATTAAQFQLQEGQALGAPALPAVPATLTTLSTAPIATRRAVIRALQVAIVSNPTPIPLENLDNPLNGAAFGGATPLAGVRTIFQNLLIDPTTGLPTIAGLTNPDVNNLMTATPNEIAALVGAWFLPAPIQRVEPVNPANVADGANNRRGSGFYDGREQRWITMLQTNIASLSVWNRDGLFVEDSNNAALTASYAPLATDRTATFAAGTGTTNNTAGLAFDRVTAFTNGAGAEIYPAGSLQSLGLGTRDTTEGGLVVYATVNDDLNGDVTLDANDISRDTTSPINAIDVDGNTVLADYQRIYPDRVAPSQSPFGFAFNGGNYLPGPTTLISDQAIYVQGNFNNNNNNGVAIAANAATAADNNRRPAAILADTITVLSNQCVGAAANNPLLVPVGQLTCGYPPASGVYNNVTTPLSINAAFLSNTQVSTGNLGNGRGYTGTAGTGVYSGGANNYIRLLENWYNGGTPLALNYTGSLVSLNQPLEYSGAYRAGGINPAAAVGALPGYYDVPFRNITFDTNFQNNRLLPPLTPKASYVRQTGFNRAY
jgi:Tfp pilus assembly protein PilX